MKVVHLEDGYESVFWNLVNRDPLHYYFFILDRRQRPEQTRICLALENRRVQGALLVFADQIVQLRGNRKAVEHLIEFVDVERVELQAPLDCEDIVEKKYLPKIKHELMLMTLKSGEENLLIRHDTVRLGSDDSEGVADLMREADREWWGNITAKDRKESLEQSYWLGVKHEGKLVAVGNTRLEDTGSNIGVIATDERFRKRGYATTLVSALVQEILKKAPPALIHVLSSNVPAVHVYSKVGFKPYRKYLLIRGERIKE